MSPLKLSPGWLHQWVGHSDLVPNHLSACRLAWHADVASGLGVEAKGSGYLLTSTVKREACRRFVLTLGTDPEIETK